MTENAQTTRRPKQLRVFMPPAPADERKAFVDSVCSLMSRSRYAPGRSWQLIVKFSDEPEKESSLYFDDTDAGIVPSYPIANVVNCYSPIDIAAGVCVASRWIIHDLALASVGLAPDGTKLAHGPPE